MRPVVLTFMLLMISRVSFAAIQTESIEYRIGDKVYEGYLAYDDAIQGKQPGVLIFHQWKGLEDYERMRAVELAKLGYIAFAADMYGKGIVAKDHKEAAELSGMYLKDRQLMRSHAQAAYDVLKNQPRVDADHLAAIGYCFGGSTVLEMARSGFDLDAVVSFHGGLKTPHRAKPGDIKSSVLVLHGADDPMSSKEDIMDLWKELDESGADWEFVAFGHTVHGFTVPSAGNDPSKGIAYNEEADKRSWDLMKALFREVFV